MNNFILFRFVPTMGCNYRCSYCFVRNEDKRNRETMFREHSPQEWIKAMQLWSNYDVEFYMWGGEPFSIPGTYEVVKGWTEYDHVVCCSRIDTNMFFSRQIVEKCPTSKIKLNCSWHLEYEAFETFYNKILALKEKDMVGMVNFVANDVNLASLQKKYRKSVDDLIEMFAKIDVFVNVAADFHIFESKNVIKRWKYQKLLSKYTSPDDWEQLRSRQQPCLCSASKHFFNVRHNGDITVCISDIVVGNFFTGSIQIQDKIYCNKKCPSLIAYPFRLDNNFPHKNSLIEYISRNRLYRQRKSS